MKNHMRLFLSIALLFVFSPAVLHARAGKDEKREEIRKMRDDVLTELYKSKPELREKIEKKAVGYAVFSNVGVNLIFASFANGRGVVVSRGTLSDTETFMRMGSAGIGLGLGLKDFRAVFVFYDRQKLEAFIEKGWDFGVQADAAAKSDNKGGAVAGAETVIADVDMYQLTKNGIALQATLQGTKYWNDKSLNEKK